MLLIWIIVALAFIVIALAYAAREAPEDQLIIVPGAIVIGLLWPLALIVLAVSALGGWVAMHRSAHGRSARP